MNIVLCNMFFYLLHWHIMHIIVRFHVIYRAMAICQKMTLHLHIPGNVRGYIQAVRVYDCAHLNAYALHLCIPAFPQH